MEPSIPNGHSDRRNPPAISIIHSTFGRVPDRSSRSPRRPGLCLNVWCEGASFHSWTFFAFDDGGASMFAYDIDGNVIIRACRHGFGDDRILRHLSQNRDALMRFLRKVHVAAEGARTAVQPDGFTEQYPALFEALTETAWDDGTPRHTSTLMLLSEAGKVKLCIHDRDASTSAWFTGLSVGACLEAAEIALQTGAADWRSKPPAKGGGGAKPR